MSSVSSSRSRRMIVPAVLVASALALGGCGSSVQEQGAGKVASGEKVTVSNCGRELAFEGAPSKVVGLHPAQTELLLRLGLKDKLVGQAQTGAQALPEDIAAEAKDVPALGKVMPPSREELLKVQPDFVYSPTEYEFTEAKGFASIEQLKGAGAQAYVATGGCEDRRMDGNVEDLFEDLENLGEIFGVQDRAGEMEKQAKQRLDAVEEATKDLPKQRVAQVYVEGGTMQAIGAGVEYDILKRAGVDNVYSPDQPAFSKFFAATISPESLAAEKPDAIVFAAYDAEHEKQTRDYLKKTFPDLPAVKNDKLIAVSTSDMFPGTLGNIGAVEQIAKGVYPEAKLG